MTTGGLLWPPRPAPAVKGKGRAPSKPGSVKKVVKVQHEALEQRALISWAHAQSAVRPELKWLWHPANGGARDGLTAKLMKAEGVKKGILDLVMLKPRGVYHGLLLELKATGSTPSDVSKEQRDFIDELRADGYFATACDGWEVAKKVICAYLDLHKNCSANGIQCLPFETWVSRNHRF